MTTVDVTGLRRHNFIVRYLTLFGGEVLSKLCVLAAFAFLARGLTPIVTHPERTAALQREWRHLEPLVREGALVQITAGSLLGNFGPAAANAAFRYLREGWVHLLASDAHWARTRAPRLAAGREAAARVVGAEAATALVETHPRAVLEGRDLPGPASGA